MDRDLGLTPVSRDEWDRHVDETGTRDATAFVDTLKASGDVETQATDWIASLHQAAAAESERQRAPSTVVSEPVPSGVEQHRAAIERAFGDLGPQVVQNFLGIMGHESGGNAAAVKTDSIEDSHGPLQINARAHPDLAAKYDLHDPAQNALAAREVYDRQGYGAWKNAATALGLLDGGAAPQAPAMPEPVQTPAAAPEAPPAADSAQSQGQTGQDLRPSQFGDPALTTQEAYSACGPAAAVAFARANGRNPTLREALDVAKDHGWTAEGGMNGIANEAATLDALGVPYKLDTRVTWGKIQQDAMNGNPVIVSTPGHYFVADAYDTKTGRYHVGTSGTDTKGGADWMTPDQIQARMGAVNGALFVDSPQSPIASIASKSADPEVAARSWIDSLKVAGGQAVDAIGAAAQGVGDAVGAWAQRVAHPDPSSAAGQIAASPLMAPGDVASSPARDIGRAIASIPSGVEAVNAPFAAPIERQTAGLSAQTGLSPEEIDRLYNVSQVALSGDVTPAPIAEAGAAAADLGAGLAELERAKVPIPRKLAEEAATAPPASAGFRQFWDRARNVIAQQGQPGQELARKLTDWRNTAETMAGDWTTRMRTVRQLSSSEFRNFVDVAEGKAEPASSVVARAAREWDTVRNEVYQRGRDAGLDIGHLENYFPHVFPEGTFAGKGWSQSLDHLVQSGQAADRAEAAQMLRYAQNVRRNRRFGNLEAEREVNLPFYKRTPDVLFNSGGYLDAAANRISQVETFGQKDADALKLIDRIGQEGGDAGAAKALYDISVGATKHGELQQRVSGALRSANSVASLGLSAITNAGQSVNTATVAGLRPTLRAAWSVLREPEAREYAIKAGVTLDNVVHDVREGTGLAGQALGKVTAPLFAPVERFNRTLALHAGVNYAEDAARKAAAGDASGLRVLDALGLDGAAIAERGGEMNAAEKMTAGRAVVERTQFKVDPQDLPGWASSPWGKVVTQFKSFSYNQSAFMGREIVAPALRGDPRPLARFMLAGLVAGAATTEAKGALQGRAPEQDPVKRILQYYQAAGGLGLVGDALRITTPILNVNADRVDPDRVVTQAVGTVMGPTVGKGIEVLSGVSQATRGNRTPLERTALRQVPVIGTTLQNLVVPYTGPTTSTGAPSGRSSSKPPSPPKAPSPPRPARPSR